MKILQISDCHIKKSDSALVYGVKTRERLNHIINEILFSKVDFEFVILTGDISDDGSIESYEYIINLLSKLKKKIYFINGNHDLKVNLISIFSNNKLFIQLDEILIENWILIGLDSCLQGKNHGYLSDSEIKKTEILVDKAKKLNKNCAIITHHPPILVNTPLIDDCPILNGSELIHIVEKNNHIKLVITGHVHNRYSIRIGNNAKLETGFSTFAQFEYGGSNEFTGIDTDNYGYTYYDLREHSYECYSILLE